MLVWFVAGSGTLAKFDTVEVALQSFQCQFELRRFNPHPPSAQIMGPNTGWYRSASNRPLRCYSDNAIKYGKIDGLQLRYEEIMVWVVPLN